MWPDSRTRTRTNTHRCFTTVTCFADSCASVDQVTERAAYLTRNTPTFTTLACHLVTSVLLPSHIRRAVWSKLAPGAASLSCSPALSSGQACLLLCCGVLVTGRLCVNTRVAERRRHVWRSRRLLEGWCQVPRRPQETVHQQSGPGWNRIWPARMKSLGRNLSSARSRSWAPRTAVL